MYRGVDGVMLEEIHDTLGKLKDKLTLGIKTLLAHEGENYASLKTVLSNVERESRCLTALAESAPSPESYRVAIESSNASLVTLVDAINKGNAGIEILQAQVHAAVKDGAVEFVRIERMLNSYRSQFSDLHAVLSGVRRAQVLAEEGEVDREHIMVGQWTQIRSHLALTRRLQIASLTVTPIATIILYFALRA